MFFAPHQAGKRSADWGAEVLEQRIGSAFSRFRQFADSWLQVRRFNGPEEARSAFAAVMNGEALPQEGYSVSLSDSA
jgi:hypothetical protein